MSAARRPATTGPRHRRRRRLAGRPAQVLLSLGMFLGLFITGTYAYWSDQGTLVGGTFATGTLDLTAGPTTGAENLVGAGPNTWNYSVLSLGETVPNESISKTFVVKNSGTTPLRFNGVPSSTDGSLTSGTSGLLVQIYDLSAAGTQSGSQSAGDRAGACTGGTQVYSQYVSASSATAMFASPVTLAAGATRSLCVRVWLNSAAPNTLMGKSTVVSIALSADQVAAP